MIGMVCVLLALGRQLRNVLVETNLQEFFDFNHPFASRRVTSKTSRSAPWRCPSSSTPMPGTD